MDLSTYVESVRRGVQNAAALGDEHTREVAERLSTSVESVSELALLSALADAAAEISVEMAPGSVEMRVSGAEPSFVVTLPGGEHPDEFTVLQPEPDAEPADGDEPQARVSLRLPQSVKEKVDEYADADGVSTNTWLLHRVLEALALRGRGRRGGSQGWGVNIGADGIRLNAPPSPPFPPMPPSFGSDFPFRSDDGREARDRDDRARREDRDRRSRPESGSGPVQGWVR